MINYKREGSVLHIKSYAFAVRIVKMFLHLSSNDWDLFLYTNKYYAQEHLYRRMCMSRNSLKVLQTSLQNFL